MKEFKKIYQAIVADNKIATTKATEETESIKNAMWQKGYKTAESEIKKIQQRAKSLNDYKSAMRINKNRYIAIENDFSSMMERPLETIALISSYVAFAGIATNNSLLTVGGLIFAVPNSVGLIAQRIGYYKRKRAYYSGKAEAFEKYERELETSKEI